MNFFENFFFNFKSFFLAFTLFFGFYFSFIFGPSIVNLSIFTLICLGIFTFFKISNYKITNENFLIVLLIFLFYLVINGLFINFSSKTLIKSISYFRFYFLILSVYFILTYFKSIKVYIFFSVVLMGFFLSIDIIYQYFNNKDIFGFLPGMCQWENGKMISCQRYSGFFDQEFIAGSYLAIFAVPSIFLSLNFLKKEKGFKFIYLIFSLLLFVTAILISGERNAVLFLIIFLISNFILNKYLRKTSLIIFLVSIFLIIFSILNINHLKHRYIEYPMAFFNNMKNDTLIDRIANNQYGMHFINSYNIFLNNKFFGTGMKTFRSECQNHSRKELSDIYNFQILYDINNGCSTHPHNLYFELISETGLVGTILFLVFLYFIIINNLKSDLSNKNSIIIISVLISLIFPFKPTGAIFSTIYASYIFFYVGLYLFFKKN